MVRFLLLIVLTLVTYVLEQECVRASGLAVYALQLDNEDPEQQDSQQTNPGDEEDKYDALPFVSPSIHLLSTKVIRPPHLQKSYSAFRGEHFTPPDLA